MTTQTEEQQNSPWTPEADTFGARLALIRHRMGWNIKEAAAACGLPAQSWRGWELDGREPHRLVTIALTIATRTNCDYLWLVHGPSRGSVTSPTLRDVRALSGYVALGEKVLSRKTRPIGHRDSGIHRPLPTRPVQQTRPIENASRRPLSPLAR